MKNDAERIAIRECATELTPLQIDLVSGGLKHLQCDGASDCWVTGGDFVFNDD